MRIIHAQKKYNKGSRVVGISFRHCACSRCRERGRVFLFLFPSFFSFNGQTADTLPQHTRPRFFSTLLYPANTTFSHLFTFHRLLHTASSGDFSCRSFFFLDLYEQEAVDLGISRFLSFSISRSNETRCTFSPLNGTKGLNWALIASLFGLLTILFFLSLPLSFSFLSLSVLALLDKIQEKKTPYRPPFFEDYCVNKDPCFPEKKKMTTVGTLSSDIGPGKYIEKKKK